MTAPPASPSFDDDNPHVAIPRSVVEDWVAVSHTARIMHDVLGQVGDPLPGSNFEWVNELYPPERASDWSRGYLVASIEHMVMWADHIAPLKFAADAVVTNSLRPVQTLARAAIESASQAVWVMAGGNAFECARRHLRLVLHDLDEQSKAAIAKEDKQRFRDARATLVRRLGDHIPEKLLLNAPTYIEMLKKAVAEVVARGNTNPLLVDPAQVERLWRAAAGSAHGKRWPTYELQTVIVGEEFTPGHHRTTMIPDPDAITHILNLANELLRYGVLRFADHCGYEPALAEMLHDATARLWEQIPKRRDI